MGSVGVVVSEEKHALQRMRLAQAVVAVMTKVAVVDSVHVGFENMIDVATVVLIVETAARLAVVLVPILDSVVVFVDGVFALAVDCFVFGMVVVAVALVVESVAVVVFLLY